MKLSLLEDGVLDYKGDAARLAVPNAVPVGSIRTGVKPGPKPKKTTPLQKLKNHVKDCPQCSKDKMCEIGARIAESF